MPETQPAASTTTPAADNRDSVTQSAINAVQQIQARSADLHAKFLDAQNTSLQTLTNIISQRQPSTDEEQDSFSAAPVDEPTPATEPVPSDEPVPATAPVSTTTAPPTNSQLNGHAVVANGHDDLRASLLAVVAQKTGYPEDMITMDMKIEEDLGIDSIKRVEILSALKDRHPQLETADDQLVTATSLHDILDFCQTEKKK